VAQLRAAGRLSQPFSWDLFDEYGAHPAPGDRHTTEFFYERFPEGKYQGKTLGMDVFSVEKTIANGDRIYAQTIELAKGDGPIPDERLKSTSGEHMQMLDIFDSVEHDTRRWYAMNVPNSGTVPNLPRDAVLELPGVASRDGLLPIPQGEAPPKLAAFVLRRCAATEAVVEAAVTGDRKLLVEAMILDGGVYDYATASKLADDLLKTHKQHLPQFA
jgi:alpha-galactosidase